MNITNQANTGNDTLRIGTELGDYRIIRLLGRTDSSIIYLAFDRLNKHNVTIREFFPTAIALRGTDRLKVVQSARCRQASALIEAVEEYVQQARALAAITHPNVAPIKSIFRALGTAYCVYPEMTGQPLSAFATPLGSITEQQLMPILKDLLHTFSYLHVRKIFHGNLKAADIIIQQGNKPVITNFLPEFFAPKNAATRDMYALAHICYTLITGTPWNDDVPPLCTIPELRKRFSTDALAAIDNVLTADPVTRCHSIGDWLTALPEQSPPAVERDSAQPPGKSNKSAVLIGIILGVLALSGYAICRMMGLLN